MKESDIKDFSRWFSEYTLGFRSEHPDLKENLILKEEHTRRVSIAVDRITSELGLPGNIRLLAQAAALFHDIGRFRQYVEYGTFRDPDSVNHAWLSLRELNRSGILRGLRRNERHLISKAVIFHNRRALPNHLRGTALILSALLRDADKLDIWKVMTDYYHLGGDNANSTIELGLENGNGFSVPIIDALITGRIPDYRALRFTNDFKILQISWVFDINFYPSLVMLEERAYLEKIAGAMPRHSKLTKALRMISGYMEDRISRKVNLIDIPGSPVRAEV